jgi:hypothetical protein
MIDSCNHMIDACYHMRAPLLLHVLARYEDWIASFDIIIVTIHSQLQSRKSSANDGLCMFKTATGGSDNGVNVLPRISGFLVFFKRLFLLVKCCCSTPPIQVGVWSAWAATLRQGTLGTWYSEQSELAGAATSPQARNRSDSIYIN